MEIREKISSYLIFFLFGFFYWDFIIYTYFTHIEALSTAIDDVAS